MLTIDSATERLFAEPGRDCAPTRLTTIDGEVPSFPRGTWFLNGPGRFRVGGQRYAHWLDGDGLVRALRFDGPDVTFASCFVRTRKFVEEERAGRAMFRTFGSASHGRLNDRATGLESPANVSILMHAGSLIALGEQGQPWQIDPETLATVGPYDACGALTPVTPFAAHAKLDPETGELFNFGVSYSVERPALHVFKFDRDGGQVFRTRVALPYCCTIHDFALTPAYAVFYIAPYLLDIARLRGGGTVMDALTWQPERGSQVMIVSRWTGELLCSAPVGSRYCLHTINGFEESSYVVLDLIEMAHPVYDNYTVPRLFEAPISARPVRLLVDTSCGQVISREELPGACAPEFPVADPADAMRAYSSFWTLGMSAADRAGTKFFNQVIRFDWRHPHRCDTYTAREGTFVGGEPLVIHDRADRRWLVCQIFDAYASRGGFAVFAADHLRQGPVAQLWLDAPTPMAFHGVFVPAPRGW
jgi:all-trans-8'-apo-beta-carotenal 15,15'-oxygenase